jgi:hypothetical protein
VCERRRRRVRRPGLGRPRRQPLDGGRRAELDLQYAPHPPFGAGSPELAGPELVRESIEAFIGLSEGCRAVLDQLRGSSVTA